MSVTVWVATADIYVGSGSSFILGYTPGNVVPDSVVARLNLATSGLVQSATIADDGTSPNWRGADPITRSELDEALAALPSSEHGTSASTPGTLVRRADAADFGGGWAAFAQLALDEGPSVFNHAARKDYVDSGDTAARARINHTGTQSADTLTDGTANKAFLAAERTKLAGVAAGATANSTDAQLRDRATHTGTQPASTISDSTVTGRAVLTAADAPSARAAIGAGTGSSNLALGTTGTTAAAGNHTHTPASIGAAAASHTHAITDLTATGTPSASTFLRGDGTWSTTPAAQGAPDATTTAKGVVQLAGDLGGTAAAPTVPGLTAKAPTTRLVTAGTGLTGGGDLSADRTLAVAYGTAAGTAVQGNDTRVTADQAAATASIRTLGTGATQAAAGNHAHTAAAITDSTATGRSVLTAADAPTARTALGAGRVDSTDASVLNVVKITQAAYTALGAGAVATTLYVIVG